MISLAAVSRAQNPAPELKDPLGRITPQETDVQFLEACHARDYSKGAHYLDLRRMPPAERAKQVASDSLTLIPRAHQLVEETTFEKRLPQGLVTFEILDTPVWRWIALIVAALYSRC
jgi:hypothetical protein